jgi:hypothetical protein
MLRKINSDLSYNYRRESHHDFNEEAFGNFWIRAGMMSRLAFFTDICGLCRSRSVTWSGRGALDIQMNLFEK